MAAYWPNIRLTKYTPYTNFMNKLCASIIVTILKQLQCLNESLLYCVLGIVATDQCSTLGAHDKEITKLSICGFLCCKPTSPRGIAV